MYVCRVGDWPNWERRQEKEDDRGEAEATKKMRVEATVGSYDMAAA